jgi:plastocyanin domain-containing protein
MAVEWMLWIIGLGLIGIGVWWFLHAPSPTASGPLVIGAGLISMAVFVRVLRAGPWRVAEWRPMRLHFERDDGDNQTSSQ